MLMVVGILAGTAGYAQNNINLNQKNDPLWNVLYSIKAQSGYNVETANTGWIKQFTVSVRVKNGDVNKAVEQTLKGLPFKYKVEHADRTINIWVDSLWGRVLDKDNLPLAGVTVTVYGTTNKVLTDANGNYVVLKLLPGDILVFSSVSTEEYSHKVPNNLQLNVTLEKRADTLDEVVVLPNGFQHVRKNKVGGSVDWTGREIFDIPLSPDFNSNIEGRVTGPQFFSNKTPGINQPPGIVRGISTFSANPTILYVLDNFPYDGDLANINPNDIERITVLKDAAAASLWGMRAGNGVIVITTKRGKLGQPLKMEGNLRTDFIAKPDLYNKRAFLGAPDFIGLEKSLYRQGYYDALLYDPSHPAVTPAVELLHKGSLGILTNAEVDAQLDALAKHDMRADLRKYAYREAVSQQYAVSVSGGGSKSSSYLFAAFDRNPGNLVNNDYHRENISFRQSYHPFSKVQLGADGMWMQNTRLENNDGILGLWYPYAQMADAKGNALAIPAARSASYIDTAGRGILQDWRLRPLDELRLANNKIVSYDLYLTLGIRYKPVCGLTTALYLKYAQGGSHRENVYDERTFFVRNMVNSYMGPGGPGVPMGAIDDQTRNEYKSQNVRVQTDYERALGRGHSIAVMAGAEQPTITTHTTAGREYGIVRGQAARINYQSQYPMYYDPMQVYAIEDRNFRANTTGNMISAYANITYSYLDRYVLSVNGRNDASNLFGADANDRRVPLWSAAVIWNLVKMPFFKSTTFSECKIRFSGGYNGNVDSSATPRTTALPGGMNSYGLPTLTLVTMDNRGWRWEKVRILNLGVDIAAWKNTLVCSAEIYVKEGMDLIADGRLDPTMGLTTLRRNIAGIISKGIDINLKTLVRITKHTSWTTAFLFNYNNNKINRYPANNLPAWEYVVPELDRSVEGYPRYGLFSFKGRGLDPQTGDPMGEWQGAASTKYYSIADATNRSSLVYSGPSIPVVFGSLRNMFSWKQVQLLVDISYKFNYYFRRSSIDYTAVWSGASPGHTDYKGRWKAPGDEKRTSIPSEPQQFDPMRDIFYTYSDALITKGDHIRLQDIRLCYRFDRNNHASLPFREMRVYMSVHNLGILWRANQYGIDPDYPETWPAPLMVAAGVKIIL